MTRNRVPNQLYPELIKPCPATITQHVELSLDTSPPQPAMRMLDASSRIDVVYQTLA
jgi:hypothetical protein